MKIMYLTLAGINLGIRGKPLGLPVEGPSKGLPEICHVISILSKAVRHLYIVLFNLQGCGFINN